MFCSSDKPVIQIEGGCSMYTALVDDPVIITTTITGIPVPTVTWKFNGNDLSGCKTVIEKSGEKHKMKIAKAAVEQTGTYTITAVNTVGNDQKNVTLNVYGDYAIFINIKVALSCFQ